tara:strand:+ start:3479 stop:3655 length:177 start_codon:yes stop_codon:yes gene_type:complete
MPNTKDLTERLAAEQDWKDLSVKEKADLTEKYIVVRQKNKPWAMELNPNYNPNRRRAK